MIAMCNSADGSLTNFQLTYIDSMASNTDPAPVSNPAIAKSPIPLFAATGGDALLRNLKSVYQDKISDSVLPLFQHVKIYVLHTTRLIAGNGGVGYVAQQRKGSDRQAKRQRKWRERTGVRTSRSGAGRDLDRRRCGAAAKRGTARPWAINRRQGDIAEWTVNLYRRQGRALRVGRGFSLSGSSGPML